MHAIAVVAMAVVAVAAPDAAAQIGRRPVVNVGPSYWVGLSYGVLDGTTIVDGNSGAEWQFGYSSQIRATIEKVLQPGFTGGLSAGFSTAPLTYSGGSVFNAACGTCRADADITQWLAFIHGGGGGLRAYGFHGLFDLEGGVTSFSNFRVHDGGARLAPTNTNYDFTFGLGGGIGYSLSPEFEVYAAEVADWVLHNQGENATTSAPRIYTFRLGGRVGF
jgi:hypothetical protein